MEGVRQTEDEEKENWMKGRRCRCEDTAKSASNLDLLCREAVACIRQCVSCACVKSCVSALSICANTP